MVGDTPCQLYILVCNTPWQLHTTAEEGTVARHDGERCNAMRQPMIRFITEHVGLEMILFYNCVNTSDVSLICLYRSCFYVFLSDRSTVRKPYFNSWGKLDLNQTSMKHLIDTHLSHWLWYQLLRTIHNMTMYTIAHPNCPFSAWYKTLVYTQAFRANA